jgi:hypothetical protein
MSSDQSQPIEGSLYITLKSYIERLEALERSKPPAQRRHVPGMEELARVVGIHPVTLSNIANSHIRQLNLETGGKIIAALRHYGFQMSVSDLIAFRGTDDHSG